MELLGIENPSTSTTFPEYLEITRRTFYPSPQEGEEGWELPENMDEDDRADYWEDYQSLSNNYRTQHGLWEDLLEEQFEVDITNITTSMTMTKDNFDTHIKSHLDAGEAVITTINGHIVSIQSYDDTGVTIDDPYGDLSGKGKINNTGEDVGLADYRHRSSEFVTRK